MCRRGVVQLLPALVTQKVCALTSLPVAQGDPSLRQLADRSREVAAVVRCESPEIFRNGGACIGAEPFEHFDVKSHLILLLHVRSECGC